ncbi:putative E3 ubiquitin-protein ligase RNF144A-B [Iris pallida]|uniref:RBR-type E3 ubiquitin transferase n=1 Tax=Iris pallida TaxID=29817 RepID=A0AAX6I869_IRIPA|nr:putative E3 ubiquitin-protein ligase RNF144A-B [Iris pallida]
MGEHELVDEFYLLALFDAEELFPISDEKYAYELQLQEALVSAFTAPAVEAAKEEVKKERGGSSSINPVSAFTALAVEAAKEEVKKERGGSSSINPVSAFTTPAVQAVEEEVKMERGEPSINPVVVVAAAAETAAAELAVCKICMDASPLDGMFENKNCPHVFCRECLGRYIGAKLRENISSVKCPEDGCSGLLEPEHCQGLVPKEVFERWGSALCEAMVLASQKFSYCPFKDCSALLVDDSGEAVGQSECPSCRRLFCAGCKVAWHSGIGCDEFRSLGADERSREDVLLMEVASKKKWRRCSSCRFYVEKKDGCNHVTCRCGFEFCYGCGVQWGGAHACGN